MKEKISKEEIIKIIKGAFVILFFIGLVVLVVGSNIAAEKEIEEEEAYWRCVHEKAEEIQSADKDWAKGLSEEEILERIKEIFKGCQK